MTASSPAFPAGRPAASPGPGLDVKSALALSVHSAPGVYAVLLGAGVSAPSGVMTGWEITKDLVARITTARMADGVDERAEAAADPEAWWLKAFNEPLGYSALLARVAPTAGARQSVLARYFEPGEEGSKGPTEAHRAIAKLALRGYIRVIMTTNFDRLMEQALDEVDVQYQTVRRPDSIATMNPLQHAQVTLIKLHGDYVDLDQRNTIDELGAYDEPLQGLLDRILDEYGLIVCGWSAEWDKALVRSIEQTRSRRFPMYWSAFSALGDEARRLVAMRCASVLQGVTADETFTDLLSRLEALETMAAPPITRDIAVTRLEKALPDPVRRIEVSKLVDQAVKTVADCAASRPILTGATYDEVIGDYRADCELLLHLLAAGTFYDDGTHAAVWRRAREQLVRIRARITSGTVSNRLEALRHYPALLATWTIGVTAIVAHREEDLVSLLAEPTWSSSMWGPTGSQKPVKYLNPMRVLDGQVLGQLHKPPNGQEWLYPSSRLLRAEVREPLRKIEPDDDAYSAACDRFEFLASLIALDAVQNPDLGAPWPGEFLLDSTWNYDHGLASRAQQEIVPGWPLLQAGAFGGEVDHARAALTALAEWRAKYHRGF